MDWNVPDHSDRSRRNPQQPALGKGFREMRELGLIARIPKIQ